jgi:TonB family protein
LAALPPGALKDALDVAGCRPGRDLTAGAMVDYRPDGRARRVSLGRLRMSRACQEVATAAVPLALAPAGASSDAYAGRHVVYVALDPSAECAEEPEPRDMRRVGEGGPIKEPRKVKHVDPRYPPAARAGGRQGTVVLEAVLGEAGCVRSVTILKGATADMDLAALRAVSEWRYTPTLVDGVPVSVFMTVTVNYRLY